MRTFAEWRTWARCAWRTGFTHELDYHSGLCRFCGQRWEVLYPPQHRPPTGPTPVVTTDQPPKSRTDVLRALWQRVTRSKAA